MRYLLSWGVALEKTDRTLEQTRPFNSMVPGHVDDIGESASTDIPLERLSTTMHPFQRGIPITMME